MNQLLFSLMLRLEGAANIKVPSDIVIGLARQGFDPDQINRLVWQYKMWSFVANLEDYCHACGGHLGLHQKQGTTTCSPRCHKLEKRHDLPPFLEIKQEAVERLDLLQQMASSAEKIDIDAYPWHKVLDGWTYALHD